MQNDSKTDLILLDGEMPLMSGYETYREIRKNNIYSDIQIAFLSGSDKLEDKVNKGDYKAGTFIKKPFRPTELIEKVQMILKY